MLCKLLCSIQLTLCVLVQSPTASEASAKDSMSVDSDDRLWSRQPGSMAGNGLDETYRKFAAARRKYMLLYFQLLQSTGRLDVLLAGHAFLQSTAWGSPAMMIDLARWDHCTPAPSCTLPGMAGLPMGSCLHYSECCGAPSVARQKYIQMPFVAAPFKRYVSSRLVLL